MTKKPLSISELAAKQKSHEQKQADDAAHWAKRRAEEESAASKQWPHDRAELMQQVRRVNDEFSKSGVGYRFDFDFAGKSAKLIDAGTFSLLDPAKKESTVTGTIQVDPTGRVNVTYSVKKPQMTGSNSRVHHVGKVTADDWYQTLAFLYEQVLPFDALR